MNSTPDDDEPLPFDTWSGISARLLKRTPEERLRILEELGLSLDEWQENEMHWARTLGAELADGDLTRGREHGARCADELAARAAPVPAPAPAASAPALSVVIASNSTLDVSAVLRDGTPLPFEAPAPGASPPSAAMPASSPSPPTLDAGATLDVSEVLRRSGELPFARSPPPPPQLSLKQYASLTVDLAVAPARAAETLARYGVALSQQAQLDAEWRARLADYGEHQVFERACTEYRAWLARTAR